MKIFLILIVSFLTSCSVLEKSGQDYPYNAHRKMTEKDYELHLNSLSEIYKKNIRTINLSSRVRSYISRISNRIYRNNENLFESFKETKFYIVNDERPFFFSVPNGNIFFSVGLIKDNIKTEDIFISLFAKEYIKSNLSIYKKNLKIPYDNIDTSNMLALNKLDIDTVSKLNELAYNVLNRSGYDPSAILLWIQNVNRNSIVFSLQYENINQISKEEFLLKRYIVSLKEEPVRFEKNSSKDFYLLKREIARGR